jgi:hypothetical protein
MSALKIPDHHQVDTQGPGVGDLPAETRRSVILRSTMSQPAPTSLRNQADRTNPPAIPIQDLSSSLVAKTCDQIVHQQRTRVYAIKRQSMADRSTEAFICNVGGYSTGDDEASRKKAFKIARDLRIMVEGGGEDQAIYDTHPQVVLAITTPVIIASAIGRQSFDKIRDAAEKEMRKLVKMLPTWPWVASVRGFGDLGLAIVVGEAGGDLSRFETVSKLWKRLGLAVINGKRQGAPGAGATADDWIAHGYNRRRRAEVWAVFSDSMFRAQWRGDRDEDGKKPEKTGKPIAVPAHPIGPYGEVYAYEKTKALNYEWTQGHVHNHARRLMTKAAIKDLWINWNNDRPRRRDND